MKLDKHKIKEIILNEIEEIKELLQDFKERTAPISPDNAIGRLSRMEALGSKSTAEFAERQAKKKLNDLNTQLNNLENGKFGECISCGDPVSLERFLFMPESLECISCSKKG